MFHSQLGPEEPVLNDQCRLIEMVNIGQVPSAPAFRQLEHVDVGADLMLPALSWGLGDRLHPLEHDRFQLSQ